MELVSNTDNSLSRIRINQIMEGSGWFALDVEGDGSMLGFDLVQGDKMDDGEIVSTCDALPVLCAMEVGNSVQVVLADHSVMMLHDIVPEQEFALAA